MEHNARRFDRSLRILDRSLRILLRGAALGIFAGAVLIMLGMDSSSRSQGGRLYVAVVAVVLLGTVEGQYARLVERRRPLWTEGPGEAAYRRYVVRSAVLLLLAALVLMGLALRLP
jgi:hypothetical protein